MVKKNWLFVSLVLMLIVAIVGCSKGTSGTEASPKDSSAAATIKSSALVEVHFAMAGYEHEVAGWTALVEAANKKLSDKNIKIIIDNIPVQDWDQYYQKMITLLASGSAPDIGRIDEAHLPVMIEKGQIEDVSDVVNSLNKSDYFENAFKGSAFSDGKSYGIPSGIYHEMLYYNKDLFDKAKLKYPSPDWNNATSWNEIRDDAKKMTSGEGANKVFGFSALTDLTAINQFAFSNDGKGVYKDDGSAQFDSKTADVFKWWDSMVNVDKSMIRPSDSKVISDWDLFKAGRLAMIQVGSWFQSTASDIKNFKVGIAASPSATGKAYAVSFVDGWTIFKGSKHLEAAKEALKALVSKEAFDALAPTKVGGFPIVKATLETMKAQMIGDSFTAVDQKAFVDGLDHIIKAPYTVNFNSFSPKISSVSQDWQSGKISVDDFIKQLEDILNKGNGIAK